jgi:hypothetical protein
MGGWGCDQTVKPLPDDESLRALPQIDDDVQRDRHESHGHHDRMYDVSWSWVVMGRRDRDEASKPLPDDESLRALPQIDDDVQRDSHEPYRHHDGLCHVSWDGIVMGRRHHDEAGKPLPDHRRM